MVNYGNGDGEFVLGWGVLTAVRLDLSLDWHPILPWASVGRVGESFQFERRADGTKRDLSGASSDFMAVPVISCPCPESEAEKEVDSVGVWHSGEHGVHSMEGLDELCPEVPIALPFVVIRSHDPSVDILPRSSEKIRKQSLSLRRKTRHELSWSGKEVSKNCKNSASDMVNVPAVAELLWNVRDATSAMVLSTPAMETEIRGDASLA